VSQVLVDLNVVLDVLLDRQPHADAAAALWTAIEGGQLVGLLSAHCVTTLHYLAARGRSRAFADRCVADVLSVFGVAPVDHGVLTEALALGWSDFEDAVCVAAAAGSDCDLIATRDLAGFRRSPVPALDPGAALEALSRLP